MSRHKSCWIGAILSRSPKENSHFLIVNNGRWGPYIGITSRKGALIAGKYLCELAKVNAVGGKAHKQGIGKNGLLAMRCKSKINSIAIQDPNMAKLASHFVKAEIKQFPFDEEALAIKWINSQD